MGKKNQTAQKSYHHPNSGSNKAKATKDKKIIGKRVNKKQISCQVKDAVERTNSCNTDLYTFYANRNQSGVNADAAIDTTLSSDNAKYNRHSLIEQVTLAFNSKGRDAAVTMATDTLERVALMPALSEQK